ncbi:MAG: hypothetical protein K2J74_05765, partial [Muribaculaceae bacterium]|nr:hypothetical protein [Muribaculaceae bacterium]
DKELLKNQLLLANENELFTRKVLNRLPESKERRTPYFLIEIGGCVLALWVCVALWFCLYTGIISSSPGMQIVHTSVLSIATVGIISYMGLRCVLRD